MKTLALTLLLLISWLPFGATAADGFKYQKRKLSQFVLTPAEYANLNLDQKVSYIKFFLVFMGTVEDMQDVSSAKKHALLDAIENFLAVLEPKAFAEEYKREGATCINSLNISSYVRSGDRLVCARPASANNAQCTGGQVSCGSAFASVVASAGSICITPPAAGTRPGHTATCVRRIAAMAGVRLDQRIADQILRAGANGQDKAAMEATAARMKTALLAFQEQRMPGGLSLRDYCARNNFVNGAIQREECGSLVRLADVFDANTILGEDAFRPGTLDATVPPAVQTQLRDVRALSDTCGPQAFDPDRAPGDMTCPNPEVRPATDTAAPPANPVARDKDGRPIKEGEAVPEDYVVDTPPPTPDRRDKDKDGGEVVPEEPPPTPRPPTPPPTDCLTRYEATLGPLACVACGLESRREANLRNGGGVSKWISLLGMMAQTYYGPYNVSNRASRTAFQKQVSEMVVSYGYCTNHEFPDYQEITPASNSTRRDWIEGRARLDDGYSGGERERGFAFSYGLMSNKRGGLFGNGTQVQNFNRPMCYTHEIFDDSGRHGFSSSSPAERQWRFRSMIAGHRSSFPNSGFGRCASAIEQRLGQDSLFRMCTIAVPAAGKPVIRPIAMTDEEWANNQSLYSTLARSCGFGERENNRDCDGGCESSTVFNTGTRLPRCKPPVERDEDEGDRPDPRPRGEPESPRDRPDPGPGPDNRGESESER